MRKRQSPGSIIDLDVLVPLLISLIVLFVIFFSVDYLHDEEDSSQITLSRENVLSLMEDKMEFCEVRKEEIQANNGRFWMLCNGRPYYAEFADGRMVDDMNGWSFLKEQPRILDELKENNCDFFYSKNSTLFFYCENSLFRIYNFNVNSFELENGDYNETVNVLLEDINKVYGCEFLEDYKFSYEGNNFYTLKLNCSGYETLLNLNINKSSFSLPVVVDSIISNEENAIASFNLLRICRYDGLNNITKNEYMLDVFCGSSEEHFIIDYDLELGLSKLLFTKNEFENSFYLFKEMVFPFIDFNKDLNYISSKEEASGKLNFYKDNNNVIVAKESNGSFIVSEIYLKDEGFEGGKDI